MNRFFQATVTATLAFASALAGAQENFPNKPLKIIVPFAPGGASDAIARPVALAMSQVLGQPVVVENKPGAAGNIALVQVARSPADGYTLLLGNVSTNAMNQTSYADRLPIVPSKELTAFGVIGVTPSVLVASMNFAPRTGQEFLAYSRAHPEKVTYWLPGVASGPHFDMVELERFAGIRMLAVPFSGGAGPGIAALVGGQVDLGLINLGGALPLVTGGKLRAYAVSTPQRLPELPDIPTAAEAGLGNLTSSWQALLVPSGTPTPVVRKLHKALNEALKRDDVKDALVKAHTLVTPSKTPEDAQAWVVGETERWGKIITASGVKPQ
ncbi:Bug family tripartite tricarboxylate transporter substrate binding protein [Hydrogenophaga laconesensis]|uniref:Tripartite-type tricarboxylate transporter receptor subunit TctC n=1 Tax=Hydrogenophaga laconesensis TaxID=1805971 RepID=A0ABU1V703_9BURK|nr:tripartite tricarboxylate transporter substrate binding protein [Hydrogenophaga laconesensis]MDR7093220.1 tripartite-type tricarboxylate transporter receptor subunit TctC [Hydrogenophaga laconesensis]